MTVKSDSKKETNAHHSQTNNSQKTSQNTKRRFTYKHKILIGVVVVLLLLLLVLFYPRGYDSRLVVESGDVQIFSKGNWVSVVNEVVVKEHSRIRTLEGEATLFLENQITRLDPNTEVTIEELSKKNARFQTTGSTWTKVLKVVKGQEVRIEHPTVVAMVRGTEFGVNVEGLLVGEGHVIGFLDGSQYDLITQQLLLPDGTIITVESSVVKARMEMMLDLLERERMHEIKKHQTIVDTGLKMSPYDNVDDALAEIDSGRVDYHAALEQSPVPTGQFMRAVTLTDLIIEQRRLIAAMG